MSSQLRQKASGTVPRPGAISRSPSGSIQPRPTPTRSAPNQTQQRQPIGQVADRFRPTNPVPTSINRGAVQQQRPVQSFANQFPQQGIQALGQRLGQQGQGQGAGFQFPGQGGVNPFQGFQQGGGLQGILASLFNPQGQGGGLQELLSSLFAQGGQGGQFPQQGFNFFNRR